MKSKRKASFSTGVPVGEFSLPSQFVSTNLFGGFTSLLPYVEVALSKMVLEFR